MVRGTHFYGAGILVDEAQDKLTLKFSITDTGIGISAQEKSKLFKSFSQTDASTTRKFGGTGLGLAISKNLVELMGGEIGVESEEGKGSTFWFTCVFSKGVEIQVKKDDEIIVKEEGERKILSILVAEDNLINQKVITASLTQLGHKVTIADNGIKTIELYNLKICLMKKHKQKTKLLWQIKMKWIYLNGKQSEYPI